MERTRDARQTRVEIERGYRAKEGRRHDALRNLEYCQRQRMGTIVDEYLNILESLVSGAGRGADACVR